MSIFNVYKDSITDFSLSTELH